MFSKIASPLVLVACLAGAAAAQSAAPDGFDPGRAELSRSQLEALLKRYDATAGSAAYTAAYRKQTRGQTALIRDRLENGDLQVGDKVQLTVEGQTALTNMTFTVEPGRVLVLPAIGDIPLTGVLRSELETHLTRELAKYIVQPTVHASSMVRITITGAVTKPGFYLVPAESLLPDALMLAGGPSSTADMKKISISRSGQKIWDGGTLQNAIVQGWTVDQLSLRAGDQIDVGMSSSANNVGTILKGTLVTIGPLLWLLHGMRII